MAKNLSALAPVARCKQGVRAIMDLPGPDQEQHYLLLVRELQAILKRKAGELECEQHGSSSGITDPDSRDTLASGKARPPTPPASKHRCGDRDSDRTT